MPQSSLNSINNGAGYRAFADPATGGSEYNALTFLLQRFAAKMACVMPVKVMAVTNSGGVTPVGFVDIMPLVNQIDGAWNAFPHGTIYHCPYQRMQGGANAIILDPVVGDIGIALFADRDISSVCSVKGQANPGSRRIHDMSDGIYIGGILNGTPTQYVEFSSSGIRMHSPVMLTLDAPTILLQAQTVTIQASTEMDITAPNLSIIANTAITGTFTVNGVDVGSGHEHSGVSTGIHNTGPPI